MFHVFVSLKSLQFLRTSRNLNSPQKGSQSVTIFRSEYSRCRKWVEEDGMTQCIEFSQDTGSAQTRKLYWTKVNSPGEQYHLFHSKDLKWWRWRTVASTWVHYAWVSGEISVLPLLWKIQVSYSWCPPVAALKRKERLFWGEPRTEKWKTNFLALGGECRWGAGVEAAVLIRMLQIMMMMMMMIKYL